MNMKILMSKNIEVSYSFERCTEACCDKMMEEWYKKLNICESTGEVYISAGGINDFLVTGIKYCPWCGQEITIIRGELI